MRKRGRGAEKIARFIGADEIYGGSDLLTLAGRGDLTASGCRRILLYGKEKIRLLMDGYILEISGSELYCTSYFRGAVRVEGEIFSLRLEGRDGR